MMMEAGVVQSTRYIEPPWYVDAYITSVATPNEEDTKGPCQVLDGCSSGEMFT